jgi:uncharacterized protein
MDKITIEHNPSAAKLEVMGVYDWSLWEKGISKFSWNYDSNETCYLLEGDVTVTPSEGAPVHITEGDLVNFPKGMTCTWEIRKGVRKHYKFS